MQFVCVVQQAHIMATDRGRRTGLHLVCTERKNLANQEAVARLLIRSGVDMTFKDEDGCTAEKTARSKGLLSLAEIVAVDPLHRAISGGPAGAGLEAKSAEDLPPAGETPLMVAAYEGDNAVLRVLLSESRPEEVRAVDPVMHRTALHFACYWGHAESCALLMRARADSTQVDMNGWSGLHMAAIHGHSAVLKALLFAEADVANPPQSTAQQPSAEGRSAATSIVNLPNVERETALHLAAKCCSASSIRVLLDAKVRF